MPIGNLTSQIFANIYLNEFDRFIRHQLKPLGYVRYGDDFVLFSSRESRAKKCQKISANFLDVNLQLKLHKRNNLIIKSHQGLHFLGHRIYSSGFVINKSNYKKIIRKLNFVSASSHLGMDLTKKQIEILRWMLLKILR